MFIIWNTFFHDFPYFFRRWGQIVWQYPAAIAICCLLVGLAVITAVIVLSLIPVYLSVQKNGDISNTSMFLFAFSLYLYRTVKKF